MLQKHRTTLEVSQFPDIHTLCLILWFSLISEV
jgi:hypothetical protein